jgi:LysW-gamma-L-alpha-aminoadipyl-6-phosphate/LysW-L-glutamyl-5-phosphate reductase
VNASVIAGGGYIGGELVRLLLAHPTLELQQVTSGRYAGRPLRVAHPNLRDQTDLCFVTEDEVTECDVLFLAAPHGASMSTIDRWTSMAALVVDLSADFRLDDAVARRRYYPGAAPDAAWLRRFRRGIPELDRDALRGASHIAMPGCMANAAILALHPLARAGLIGSAVIVDARTGSSGGGRTPDEGSHHPERSGALRTAKPHGHRHTAEIEQACGVPVRMSVTAVEAVRALRAPSHPGAEDPQRLELLRHRAGARPRRRPLDRRGRSRQPDEGGCRQCRAVRQHRLELGRSRWPALRRTPPGLSAM